MTNEKTNQHNSSKDWGIPSVFMTALLPGFVQLRTRPKWLGVIGVSIFALSWVALISAAVLAVVAPSTALDLVTSDAILTAMIVWVWLAIALVLATVITSLISALLLSVPKSRKILLSVIVLLIGVAQLAALGFAGSTVNAQREFMNAVFSAPQPVEETQATPTPESSGLTLVDGRVNVLLLGGDAGEGRVGLRPDSISVVSVDPETGESIIIGVPRNLEQAPFAAGSPLYGPFPNGYDCGRQCLISYLYTYGNGHPDLYSAPEYAGRNPGIEATRDAVEGVLGIEIPYTVLIDMKGFSSLVDAVGGITVCVPIDTLAQDKKTVFKAGCQHMTGDQALLYSRTRYDSNDYGRMAKQRLVQEALLEQISPLALLTNFQKVAAAGSQYISTDIPRDQLAEFVDVANLARKKTPQKLELVPPTIDVTAPDFAWIQSEVQRLLAN